MDSTTQVSEVVGFTFVASVRLEKGLHMRPANELVAYFQQKKLMGTVKRSKPDTEAGIDSIMSILLLAAECGTDLEFVFQNSLDPTSQERVKSDVQRILTVEKE